MRITPCGSCGKPALWFVITIADRSHRGPDPRLPTSQTKADRRVLAPLVRVVNDLVGPPPTPQSVLLRYPGGDDHVLSGLMRGANEIRNRAAIVDQPSGKGRVILFAGNPCYRWQNFGEFNMLFNTVLNYNDIKTEPPKAATTDNPAR